MASAWEPVFRPTPAAPPAAEPLAHACTWDPADLSAGSKKWRWGRRQGGGGGGSESSSGLAATAATAATLHQAAAEADYLRGLVQDQASHLAALAADRERAAAEAAAAVARAAYLEVRHELLVDMWTLRVLDNEALGAQQHQQQHPPPPPPQPHWHYQGPAGACGVAGWRG